MVSSKPIGKKSVDSYANGEISPPICKNSGAGNKQRVQQDYAALDRSGFPRAMYRWRKLKINYSEEILRMYPYLAEPDSDGEDDIEEGEEDEYMRWDPVQKVHVKRETPLREIAKQSIDITPTAETDRFLPEDMVTVEILLKMVSEADDFSSSSTTPEPSPARAFTPPNTSIPESLPLSRECDGPLETYDHLPIARQEGDLVMEPLGQQNEGKNINILPEHISLDSQRKTEEIRVKSDFKGSCTRSDSPVLSKTFSGETTHSQNMENNHSPTPDDTDAVAGDTKSVGEGEKVFAEPSRYFIARIKNGPLHNFHFNECNPEHRFHDFRGCKGSRRAIIIYRRTYKRPMSRVTYQSKPLRKQWSTHVRHVDDDQTTTVREDVENSCSETGSYYSWEFTPRTREEPTDLGNKPVKPQNLWGVLEIDNKPKLTHSIDNYGTSVGILDLAGCGYMPLKKPLSIMVGGYLGFSASISKYVPDYDKDLVDRCLAATKKRPGPVSVTEEPSDSLPDMARDLAYQKGEAAGRQHMMEAAVKIANEIVKQQLYNACPEKSESTDTNLTIERSLQRVALGSYEEDHTQHEEVPNHVRATPKHCPPHVEFGEAKSLHGGDHTDWSNKKTKEFKRLCGMSDHSFKEYPLSLKNSGEKRKHHEGFEEVRGSSRKHRRRRSVSKENDSRRHRRQDKSRSRSRPSRDSGRRYDEKNSPSRPHKDPRRRHDDSDSSGRFYKDTRRRQGRSRGRSKPKESDRRYDGKNSPSRSHKGPRRRHDDSDSPDRSQKDPRHSQHGEINSLRTIYKDSHQKKGDREAGKSRTKTKDRSPNRGRHRDRYNESGEYQTPEQIIGDIISRKRRHCTPSLHPLTTLVGVNPQKEVQGGIFATPKDRNEQERLEEVRKSRRSSQGHHKSTTISDTIRDIKIREFPLKAETIAVEERSVTPKAIPTHLTVQKKATSKEKEKASQADIHPTSKVGWSLVREGAGKEASRVGIRKTLEVGNRIKRAASNQESLRTEFYQTSKVAANLKNKKAPSEETSKAEVYQPSQDGPSITRKVTGKEAPQVEVHQAPRAISSVKDSTSKEERLPTDIHLAPQVGSFMAKKELGPRDYQSPKVHHSQEHRPQAYQPHYPRGHFPQGHYPQDNPPQDHSPQAHPPQGYQPHDHHTQGHQPQSNRFQSNMFQGHQPQSHHSNFSLVPSGNFKPRNVHRGSYRGSNSTFGERQRY